MPVSLAFGVLFATVVILLVVTPGYIMLEDMRRFFSQKKAIIGKNSEEKG